MMHLILAIDPGVTTGWCWGNLYEHSLEISPQQSEMTTQDIEILLLNAMHSSPKNLHVVYEDFQFRNASRSGLNLYPAKLQGVIELVSEKNPQVPFYVQQPSVQGDKAYFSNDRLKELGIYKRGTEHGRSAEKHLLHWLAFKEGSQFANIEKLELKLV